LHPFRIITLDSPPSNPCRRRLDEQDSELPQYAQPMADEHDEAHHFLHPQPPPPSSMRHRAASDEIGPRDRRVRLSAHTAIQFYDVQDRLGFDRPSKAVDWLIRKAQTSIDELAQLPPWSPADAIRNAKPRRTAAKTKISPSPPPPQREQLQFGGARSGGFDGEAELPSFLPPSTDSESFFPVVGSSTEAPPRQDLRLSLHSFPDGAPSLLHHHHHHHSAPEPVLFYGQSNPFGYDGWEQQSIQRLIRMKASYDRGHKAFLEWEADKRRRSRLCSGDSGDITCTDESTSHNAIVHETGVVRNCSLSDLIQPALDSETVHESDMVIHTVPAAEVSVQSETILEKDVFAETGHEDELRTVKGLQKLSELLQAQLCHVQMKSLDVITLLTSEQQTLEPKRRSSKSWHFKYKAENVGLCKQYNHVLYYACWILHMRDWLRQRKDGQCLKFWHSRFPCVPVLAEIWRSLCKIITQGENKAVAGMSQCENLAITLISVIHTFERFRVENGSVWISSMILSCHVLYHACLMSKRTGQMFLFQMPQILQVLQHFLVGEGEFHLCPQRGPLQSSYTPMIRAWFDPHHHQSISTEDLSHHIPPPVFASGEFSSGFRVPARFQGQEEEQQDGLTNKPSSASSVSRH
ncbi:hypothetical protein HID58_003315, partial [Brassica napus]